MAGTHSLVWDEAAKITGADADFHRRDLWEAIEAGAFPQWELALQLFSEEQAEQFEFDVLDATKIVPEELAPLTPVGKLTLNRNPDNFFAETEQVAFCTAHVVPGIDFSNDPLLQGRLLSYLDTQISRLGGPNFHEIPINAPLAAVQNNQRDGMHRQALHRGRASYEPNSLGGGCPFQAGMQGFTSFPQRIAEDKVRGKAELFADHYSQARLFWNSQSAAEQSHIVNAYRFELTRVQTPAVRVRVVSMLANVDATLANGVADALGIELPAPMPLASSLPIPQYAASPALSLLHRPGETGIRTRRVAILIAPGVDGASARAIYAALLADGAVPRLVGAQLGKVSGSDGASLDVEISLEAAASVLYDAMVIPDGEAAAKRLSMNAHALDFVRDQYRHCKPILVVGAGTALLAKAGIPTTLPDGSIDLAIIGTESTTLAHAMAAFKTTIATHRSFLRESDPPTL
jgi:catalase